MIGEIVDRIATETGIAVVAAGVGSLATLAWGWMQEVIRFRRLRQAFGKGVRSPNDIALSIPLWITRPADRNTHRFLKCDNRGVEEKHHGPSEMLNSNDMFAAASIINLFAEFFSKPVVYLNDRDEPLWRNRTVIIIGSSVANLHARRFEKELTAKNGEASLPRFVI